MEDYYYKGGKSKLLFLFLIGFALRNRRPKKSKQYRVAAEETEKLTGTKRKVPNERDQKLPRLLSKDSDDDDDVLISMIEKEANMKDIYTKFDENLMEAKGLEKAGETNVKGHPGFSLY